MDIYLVGGAVRDELLGITSKDKDYVVVNSSIKEMLELGFIPVGKDFPVFLHPNTKEEYALARTERKISSGYKGFEFYTADNIKLEDDLRRRDLTINAIAKNLSGDYFDPFLGIEDLNNRILRHVSPAFVEDPLRVLRLARFYAQLYYLDFRIDKHTIKLCMDIVKSGELQALSKERIWQETQKALTTKNPSKYFDFLYEIGGLEVLSGSLNAYYRKNRDKINIDKLAQKYKPQIIFGHLLENFSIEGVNAISKDFMLPNIYYLYCKNAIYINKFYQNMPNVDSEKILELCKNIDFWRKSELNIELFSSFNLADLANLLVKLLSIKAEKFILQGYKGKQIGELIYLERKQFLDNTYNNL